MIAQLMRLSGGAAVVGAIIFFSPGCAVYDDGTYGYDSGASVGVGLDYYEPFGFGYGPWGQDYQVGPYRGGDRRPQRGANAPGHSYRPAPNTHSVPSIPSSPRSHGAGPNGVRRR